MRSLRRWYTWVLCAVSMSALAEVPYCPPSLEAPLDGQDSGVIVALPRGHLFHPLIADPKESRFFLGYREYDGAGEKTHVAVIGFGETFPLFRRLGDCPGDGWQLDIFGGGVARFILDESRNDLIDADYRIGIPLSWRHGNWSLRSRVYHESSHLGENELFQGDTAERVKRSYDVIDFLGSYDEEKWRLYFGAEYFFRHRPSIDQTGWHVGAEYYGRRNLMAGTARWVNGLDVKAYEEYDYSPDVNFKTGLSFGGRYSSQHHLQVLLEWYDGHANEGVSFDEEVRYLGVNIFFGF